MRLVNDQVYEREASALGAISAQAAERARRDAFGVALRLGYLKEKSIGVFFRARIATLKVSV